MNMEHRADLTQWLKESVDRIKTVLRIKNVNVAAMLPVNYIYLSKLLNGKTDISRAMIEKVQHLAKKNNILLPDVPEDSRYRAEVSERGATMEPMGKYSALGTARLVIEVTLTDGQVNGVVAKFV